MEIFYFQKDTDLLNNNEEDHYVKLNSIIILLKDITKLQEQLFNGHPLESNGKVIDTTLLNRIFDQASDLNYKIKK